MPNIAVMLKQEITRLARKETRSLTKSLSKASAQFRRDIAELKRRNSKARAEIVRLQRQLRKGGTAPAAEADVKKVRFTAAGVTSQRKRMGISAADYGKLIGVTAHTVYKWEHGAAKPRRAQLETLAALRGTGKTEARARLQRLGAKAATGRKKKG